MTTGLTIIPDEQGSTELNPARFNALRNLCLMARQVAEARQVTPAPSPDVQPTLADLEKVEYLKAYRQAGTVRGAAELLDVSAATVSNKFQSWRIRPQRIATNIVRLAACGLLVALVGCAAKPAVAVRSVPPLPSLALARASSVSVKSDRMDSAIAVAPQPVKPWAFKWNGPTNGWVHVVGRKETLSSPWNEFARVTNRTECPVPPGFYTILRMEDTDLPGHVWVRR